MKFLTGILNSRLIAFWLKNKGNMQGDNFQVAKEPLLNIPLIKNPSESQQKFIIDLVDKIISKTRENSESDTSSLESQIDELVYKLYKLTPEEISIYRWKIDMEEIDDFFNKLCYIIH